MPRVFKDLLAQAELLERSDGGLDHIGVIARAERLGEHVADARRFDDGTHAAAGDDAGAGRSRAEQHAAAAVLADDFMRDGVVAHGDLDHGFLGRLGSLANRFADFVRLAETDSRLCRACRR